MVSSILEPPSVTLDDKDLMFNRFMAEEHEPGLRTVFFFLREKGSIVGTTTMVVTVFVV